MRILGYAFTFEGDGRDDGQVGPDDLDELPSDAFYVEAD